MSSYQGYEDSSMLDDSLTSRLSRFEQSPDVHLDDETPRVGNAGFVAAYNPILQTPDVGRTLRRYPGCIPSDYDDTHVYGRECYGATPGLERSKGDGVATAMKMEQNLKAQRKKPVRPYSANPIIGDSRNSNNNRSRTNFIKSNKISQGAGYSTAKDVKDFRSTHKFILPPSGRRSVSPSKTNPTSVLPSDIDPSYCYGAKLVKAANMKDVITGAYQYDWVNARIEEASREQERQMRMTSRTGISFRNKVPQYVRNVKVADSRRDYALTPGRVRESARNYSGLGGTAVRAASPTRTRSASTGRTRPQTASTMRLDRWQGY